MRNNDAGNTHGNSPVSDFYRDQLLDNEQLLYRQIAHDLGSHKPKSVFSGDSDARRLLTIARYVTLDYPEFYWSKGDFSASGQEGLLTALWDDLCPDCWVQKVDEEIFRTVEGLGLDRFSSVKEKVSCLQEWFLSNVSYDQGTDRYQQSIVQTIFPVFAEGRGVCLGIAKAAKLMLDLSGEHSIIILGRLFQDKTYEHAWNLIWDGDRYLHADFTMAYPVFESLWHSCYPEREQSCLLVPGEEIQPSHSISPDLTYPG